MGNDVMVTTYDNPWNPFTDWVKWWNYDQIHGYKTWEKIDRLCKKSSRMTASEQEEAIEEAIDDLITNDFTGVFVKVTPETAKELVEKRNGQDFEFLP